MKVIVQERNRRSTPLGSALQIKVFASDFRRLGWSEVWEAFAEKYPGQWALECYPPRNELVDGKNVYHLFVLDVEPQGLNIRK